MSSRHMVRVLRNGASEQHPAPDGEAAARTRTILLASLTFCVACLVGAYSAPQLPGIVASLQQQLSLSQHLR